MKRLILSGMYRGTTSELPDKVGQIILHQNPALWGRSDATLIESKTTPIMYDFKLG